MNRLFSKNTKASMMLLSSVVMRRPSGDMRTCALSLNEMHRSSWSSWRAEEETAVKRVVEAMVGILGF